MRSTNKYRVHDVILYFVHKFLAEKFPSNYLGTKQTAKMFLHVRKIISKPKFFTDFPCTKRFLQWKKSKLQQDRSHKPAHQPFMDLTLSMKSVMITKGFSDRLSANQLPYKERAEG